ncbi:MAG: glycosyltransferase [Tepidisphaeraceae bacterium]|jgi:glycosyltransferase involved in cell wall biosynthesis
MSPKSNRALLIAEACNPEWVSIPLEGWSHSRAIASLTPAHLVTQIRNRDALLRAGLVEGRDFTAIDSEPAARPAYALASLLRGGKGKGWTTATALSAAAYPYFEHLLWQKFAPRIADGEFDLVHRLTPLSPTIPSSIAQKCRAAGVPFILGPLNGGVPWPAGFDASRRREKEWLSYIRDAHRFLPGYLQTRRCASAILIGSRDTWRQMPRGFHAKCFYVPENGYDPERFTTPRQRKAERPIRAIFVGRLVPYKGADMLLEAAAPILKSGAMTLDIIGDGPQKAQLAQTIRRENLESSVKLPGFVPHAELQKWLVAADLFTFPSVREFGGAVILEAMAMGAVPMVVDYGGPGELTTPNTGFLIPLGSRTQIIEHLRRLLSDVAANPESLHARSESARDRARRHFTWQAKARSVIEIYRWVRGLQNDRPNCPMPIPDDA